MSVFGVVTVRRVVAAQVADEPTSPHPRPGGAIEQVAMLDVDEINGIRNRRLHALGLAAAGDTDGPDAHTIEEARAAQARGIVLDGEQVATTGNIVVLTRGGIAGWLKRNRGKKADPETLAWLRGEEAAEGRAAYAGWADRDDANILNWARDQRRSGAAQATGQTAAGAAQAAALREAGLPEAASQVQASGHDAAESAGADGSGGTRAESAHADLRGDAATDAPSDAHADGSGDGPPAIAHDHDGAGAAAQSPAVQRLDRIALGTAGATAREPRAAVDPSAGELASLRERLQRLISTGAVTISIRDHRIVLLVVCDRLFEHNQPELTLEGARAVRHLGRLLAGDRGQAYKVIVDRERTFELVSNLAIGGLAPERIEIALKQVDRAIDIVEVEWTAVKDLP
ncbi:MAG TPA: hypothetical protein VGD37_04660 [Kofleriaceae bacterium]